MELDELKDILNKDIPTESISDESFKKVKKWKSLHPAEKIKRKLLLDVSGGIILFILYAILLIKFRAEFSTAPFSIILSILAVIVAYSIYSYAKITRLISYGINTNMFLIVFNKAIRKYIRDFSLLSLVLVAPIFLFGVFVGYANGAKIEVSEVFSDLIQHPKALIFVVITTVTISAAAYYATYFLYRLIYIKQIKQIDALIKEFE